MKYFTISFVVCCAAFLILTSLPVAIGIAVAVASLMGY